MQLYDYIWWRHEVGDGDEGVDDDDDYVDDDTYSIRLSQTPAAFDRFIAK